MIFEFGSIHNNYQVFEVLGRGSFGTVYKALDLQAKRWLAMKVLSQLDEHQFRRIEREYRIQSALKHMHIAEIYGAFEYRGSILLMMELLSGGTLQDRLLKGALPLPEAVRYLCELLSGLGYTHGEKVLHRDIKPANIMFTAGGIIKLGDFGIARTEGNLTLTATNHVLGSPNYMSPEQINGRTLDARSDLFAVGVVAYEMLLGLRPFEGVSTVNTMYNTLREAPRHPLEVKPDLGPGVAAVVLKALEKDPEKRYQTAGEFRSALEEAVRMPTAKTVVIPPPLDAAKSACAGAGRRGPWRPRVLCLIALFVSVVGLLGVGFAHDLWFRDAPMKTISKVPPEYTREARQAGREGEVVLESVVQADGRAHDITVTKSLGMGLDEQAVNALRIWKFRPARRNGKAVPTHLSTTFEFRLKSEKM